MVESDQLIFVSHFQLFGILDGYIKLARLLSLSPCTMTWSFALLSKRRCFGDPNDLVDIPQSLLSGLFALSTFSLSICPGMILNFLYPQSRHAGTGHSGVI